MIRNYQTAYILFSLFLLVITSCQQESKNIYNENDYTLLRIDSFKGKLDAAEYVYKYDSLRKMQIGYFYNGNILSRNFIYKDKLDGPFYTYTYSGEVQSKTVFSDGKQLSKEFYKVDTTTRIIKDDTIYAPGSDGKLHKIKP